MPPVISVDDVQMQVDSDHKVWFSRIEKSEKVMREKFRSRWILARKRLRSELNTKKQKGDLPSHEQVNLAYSIGINFVNASYFRSPDVNLTAKNEREVEAVENTEIKINEYLKDKMVKKTIKRALWDAYSSGFGAVYVDYEYRDYDSGEPILDSSGQPIVDPATGQVQTQRIATKNSPVIKRIRPDLLRFPLGFDFDNAMDSPWIAFEVILALADVKNDETFDVDAREQIKGNRYDKLSDEKQDGPNFSESDDTLYAKIAYVFQKPQREGESFKLLILCKESNKPLLETDYDRGHVGYPLHFIIFNPQDDDEPYPCGDVWLFESQLQAVDDWWLRMVNHVRRTHPKWLYLTKHIGKETIQKLKGSQDLVWIGLEPKADMPVANLIQPLQHPELHKDNHILLDASQKFLSEISPSSAQTRGQQQSDTATEANIINEKEMIDLDARVDAIKDLFIELVRDLAGLYANNMQGNTMIRGKSKTGQIFSREIDKSGFTTAFESPDINVESMTHPNKHVLRMQLERDMQLLAGFIEPQLNKSNKTINFEFFIKKWFELVNIKNADEAIIPLNIRNPNKEHEDYVFGDTPDGRPLPMLVQQNENFEEHLKEHEMMMNDEIASQIYEKLKPGFIQNLGRHIVETQAMMAESSKKSGREKSPFSAQRKQPLEQRS